jgi:replication-associated recombination protein RarA
MSIQKIPPTIRGYSFNEVASAFQKCIRRGLEEDSLYWAAELDRSGYGEYVWKRIRMITSEDIGLAEPNLPANIYALYETWSFTKKKKDERCPERMFMVHAILLLVRAKKSRICDHSKMWAWSDHIPYREIPDVALDKHTWAGKKMGRGFDHFFDEGMYLENADLNLPDVYQERARALRTGALGEAPNPPRPRAALFAEGTLDEDTLELG